jgi:outer membrane protein insertion porin family
MKLSPVFCIVLFVSAVLLLTSCGTENELTKKRYKVKNHPKEKPFVYYNQINISNPKLTKEEKTILTSNLTTQLDDSMQVRVKEKLLFFKNLVDPSLYDSLNADASARNMEIYLKTVGYYYGSVSHRLLLDTVPAKKKSSTQIHAITEFDVNTGPLVHIDSINYLITDTIHPELSATLQTITDQNRDKGLLKKGSPFTEQLILNELERLVELYRNNGYYKFSREQLYVDADSFYVPLLNPFLDPFERIQVLQDAQKWRANPTFNVFIRLKPKNDSTALMPYTIGTINVEPEYTNAAYDTLQYKITPYKNIVFKTKTERFKPAFIANSIQLKPGNIYRLSNLTQTLDELNNVGTWQFIKVEPIEKHLKLSNGKDSGIVDFDFKMVPSKKFTFNADLEGVFNQVQQAAVGIAGNLIGVGVNLGIRDRNFAKRGIQFNNTFRFGVESGIGRVNPGLQAIEFTYSTGLVFPKLVFKKRTFINATASYIDRNINANGLYSLSNINLAGGWQHSKRVGKKNFTYTIQPLNVEFVRLFDKSQPFEDTLSNNPFLQFSFREGLVIGMAANLVYTKEVSRTKTIYWRFGLEESGLTWGRLFRPIASIRNQLFSYIKADVEVKYTKVISPKSNFVVRGVVGAGYNVTDTASMPFFKQFTGGGPNSMRAWPLRSIGPGSRPLDSRSGRGQFFSRSGDFIFEANAEYRYNIYTFIPNTFVLRGALFTDVGNVWNFKNRSNIGNDTVVVQMKNFVRDLGVSAGTGFRLDFVGLFVIRFDFALRMKNPSKPFSDKDNGWRIPALSYKNLLSGNEINRQWRYENFNFSIGINYPF